MKIESIIKYASEHFLKNYSSQHEASIVFGHYVLDELDDLHENLQNYLAGKADPRSSKHPQIESPLDAFYIWYYINYVQVSLTNVQIEKPFINWNIGCEGLEPDGIFTDIFIQPVNSVKRNGKVIFQRCDRKTAELWTVQIKKISNGDVTIAYCKNEITAYVLANNLRALISNWQIKVLIDIKDASINEIYSNHMLKVATVDRDVLENEDEDSKSDMVRERNVLTNATPGEFYSAIPNYEEEDQIVRDQLKTIGF